MFGGFGLGVDGVAFRKQPHEPLCIKGPPDRAGAERWVKAFLLTFVFFPLLPLAHEGRSSLDTSKVEACALVCLFP